jgi:hypothetical protein
MMTATACCNCERPFGGRKPNGMDGAAFGFAGRICQACYRSEWGRRRAAPPCDLCGTAGGEALRGCRPTRRDGSRFGLEGKICLQCWRELAEEQGEIRDCLYRHVEREHPREPGALPVLNPSVSLDGVTPALACRVILAATRRVFARRATG